MTVEIRKIDQQGWWNKYDCGYEFVIDDVRILDKFSGRMLCFKATLFSFPNRNPQVDVTIQQWFSDYTITDKETKQEVIDAALKIVQNRINQLSKKKGE